MWIKSGVRNPISNRSLAIISLLFPFFPILDAVAGTPSIHEKLAHRLVAVAHSALIQYGYCADENDCNKKEYAYWSLTKSSVTLGLYDIHDMRVVSAVAAASLAEYDKSEKRIFITAKVYRERYEDVRGVIKSLMVKPYIELNLRGDQE